jgi:FAD:protein FMN transferase
MPLAGLLTRFVADGLLPERVRREGVVMGTRFRVDLHHPGRPAALGAAEAALREIERLDRVLTTWQADSPMSEVNRAPAGVPVHPDAELFDLLAEAESWAVRTGRAFDPSVGALVDAWGLRSGGVRPAEETLVAARRAVGRGAFALDPVSRTVIRRDDRAWIDTGCFGKGAALRAAAARLADRGVRSALLDLGGQLLAVGEDASAGASWEVGVAHPSRRREAVARLLVHDVSVSTSGNSERAGRAAGETIGHLIDPRAGEPAPVWGSVTVVAADALTADVLSTALYVMGPEAGAEWSRGLTDEGVLFLEEKGGALVAGCNTAMERWLVEGSVPLLHLNHRSET